MGNKKWPEKGWLSFAQWKDNIRAERKREEMVEGQRNALFAIRCLTNTLLSDDDLADQQIARRIAEIGQAITTYNITDDMIAEVVMEVREQKGLGHHDDDSVGKLFNNVVPFLLLDKPPHVEDGAPEKAALYETTLDEQRTKVIAFRDETAQIKKRVLSMKRALRNARKMPPEQLAKAQEMRQAQGHD